MSAVNVESAHLAGHSRGGYAVTRLALEHPEVVRTLTIIDSSTLMTPPNPIYDEWSKQAANIPDPRAQIRYLVGANSFSDAHLTEHYIDVAHEIRQLEKTKEVESRMADGLRDHFKADVVARQQETQAWIRDGGIKAPTLVIWAFNDPSATMERCGVPCMDLIMSSVSNSQMHILNEAGHYCFREQPEGFETVLTSFIQKNSPGR
jgi:pimeloyl-ACP methyl ester carboxylesterase